MEPEKIKAIDDVVITDEEINAWPNEWFKKVVEILTNFWEPITGDGVPKQ